METTEPIKNKGLLLLLQTLTATLTIYLPVIQSIRHGGPKWMALNTLPLIFVMWWASWKVSKLGDDAYRKYRKGLFAVIILSLGVMFILTLK